MSLVTFRDCSEYTLQYIQCKTNSTTIISLLIFRPELLTFTQNKYCRTSYPVGKWPFGKQSTDSNVRYFDHCICISVFHSAALCSLHVKTLFTKIYFLGLVILCTCFHSYFIFAGSIAKDIFLCQCFIHVLFNYLFIL